MNIFEAIILGIIQGLTEFLPISSTAHLTLAGKIMHLIDPSKPEQWTAFIATIQLGTLIAVLFYFAKDIINISGAYLSENLSSNKRKFGQQSVNSKLGWYIIIGTIPIVIIGYSFKKIIEGDLTKDLYLIATSLIILALILALAEKIGKRKKALSDITLIDSISIGFAQCLALIPGSSRSGTTITFGLFAGLTRESAARFSFLLSIPAVFASGVYEFYKSLPYISSGDLINLILSTLFAAISGYLAIAFLLNYLKTKTTLIFIVYRIILGLLIFAGLFFKII